MTGLRTLPACRRITGTGIYRAVHGETLAATVKRLRLHRAAGDLVRTTLSVDVIARRAGYPNLQSFTRIFKSVFGMPPAHYRREGSHTVFQSANGKGFGAMYPVTTKTIAPRALAGVSHTGSYMGHRPGFRNAWRHAAGARAL